MKLVAAVLAVSAAAVLATDPDAGRNMIQLVSSRGYPIEEHFVQTEDGYILGMFRIPHGLHNGGSTDKPRPVALLQHGLLDSSFTWVNNLNDESLAYLLADAGWDVWMGNSRGNTWSKQHVSLDPSSQAFWDFSFDEMASKDLPALVDYTLAATGVPTLSYVGHSQGTIQAFAAFSENASLAAKVNYFGALAPVAHVGHTTVGVLHLMADLDVAKVLKFFGGKEFLPSSALMRFLGLNVCKDLAWGCDDVIFWLCGQSGNLNQTRTDVYLAETPAGTSVKNMAHWSQLIKSNAFQKYDYGCGWLSCHNKDHYGQKTPPAYDLTKVTVPTGLYSGGADTLADTRDVAIIRAALPNLVHDLYVDDFAHLDFTWGFNANTKVYEPLIQHMTAAHRAAYPDAADAAAAAAVATVA